MTDETSKFDQGDITANKGMACLSYLAILFIIPLLTNKGSAFTKFHINQGIVLFILGIIAGFISGFLAFIPVVGGIISIVISFGLLALMLMGLINTLNGKAVRLPIIGNFQIIK